MYYGSAASNRISRVRVYNDIIEWWSHEPEEELHGEMCGVMISNEHSNRRMVHEDSILWDASIPLGEKQVTLVEASGYYNNNNHVGHWTGSKHVDTLLFVAGEESHNLATCIPSSFEYLRFSGY